MNTDRIQNVLDVKAMENSQAAIIGTGGGMAVLSGLVRSGLGAVIAVDPDVVDATNVARQGHHEIGASKVEAARNILTRINPKLNFQGLSFRHDEIPDATWDKLLKRTNLLILATDSFEAQAFGNRLALRLNIPAMWIGLYPDANAGEIVWWTPDHEDCFRCLLEKRFLKQEANRSDPISDNALIQDLQIVDGIAGHIALGLLTQGSQNYFGKLINNLGDRQFLQIKLRYDWMLSGIDPIAKALQVPPDNDNYFCWSTVVKRNGPRLAPCPDCIELQGRVFEEADLVAVEVGQPQDDHVETDSLGDGRGDDPDSAATIDL
jgi:molybdopterin/thiamine biosynthesis adenylyltransferase